MRRTPHGSVLHINARYSPATRAAIDAGEAAGLAGDAYLDGLPGPVLCGLPGPFEVSGPEDTAPWCQTCGRELDMATQEVRAMGWWSEDEGRQRSREATVLDELEDDW